MSTTPAWLRYANQNATRNQPLSPELVQALSFLPSMGVLAEVFSGGQPATGPNRVGSHRHDHGNAADVFFYKDGRRLDWANPKDRPIFEEIVRRAKAAGVQGIGAGPGYMRPGSMHIGFGAPAVWGAGGKSANAPDWLVAAYNSTTVDPAPREPAPPLPAPRFIPDAPVVASVEPARAAAPTPTPAPAPTPAPVPFQAADASVPEVGPDLASVFGGIAQGLMESAAQNMLASAQAEADWKEAYARSLGPTPREVAAQMTTMLPRADLPSTRGPLPPFAPGAPVSADEILAALFNQPIGRA